MEKLEFKGTRGEWFVSGSTEVVSMPIQCKITKVSGWNYEQSESNAKLIAAAPDLLETLQSFYEKITNGDILVYFDPSLDAQQEFKKIEKAIEKALK